VHRNPSRWDDHTLDNSLLYTYPLGYQIIERSCRAQWLARTARHAYSRVMFSIFKPETMTGVPGPLPWQYLSRIVEIRSPWLSVIGERLVDGAGQELDYWRVEKPDSLLVITVHRAI